MNLLELSQTIRKVRQAQKMTVEQLAKRSGFSKGFISQVENFRTTPSVKALCKIADALGIGVSELFDRNGQGEPFSFGNLEDGVELQRDDGAQYGIRYLALAHRQLGRKMDPFIIEYTSAPMRDFLAHDSEEFFVLLEGEILYYVYDTKSPRRLKPGDTVYMKAHVPHAVALPETCSHAKALVVYSDPSSSGD